MPGPHDDLFKYAFSDLEEARPLLRSILPSELVREVEWSTLAIEPGAFVDEALSSRHTDLLFSASAQGDLMLLYLVVEHQSRVDPLMAYRMLRYLTRVWDRWLREHPNVSRLPRVVPIVIYAGERRWDAPTSVEALIDGPETASTPRMSFILDDLSDVSESALSARSFAVLGEVAIRCLLRLPRSSDPVGELRRLEGLLERLLAGPGGLDRLVAVLVYLSRVANVDLEDVRRVVWELSPRHEEKTMTTLAKRMENAAQAKMILKLLRLKFISDGPLPEAVVARVEAGTEADVERWTERFVLAPTLEQVFDDSPLG